LRVGQIRRAAASLVASGFSGRYHSGMTRDAGPDDRLMQAMAALRAQARPEAVAGMARFGMNPEGRLGLSVPMLRQMAKGLGRDHLLAQALWDTGVPEAQIVAALVAEPARFTVTQMNHWVRGMRAWDTCDQACTNAFARSPLAWARLPVWATWPGEFERRAAFALLAALAVHDKGAPDDRFLAALPLIEAAADDERNFVRKAVNWALRQIGKRNANLLSAATACALRLRARPSRAARWIASDALREWQARQNP
jgi:3-methyladenine DNA glycosylase AlkD